MSDAAWVCECSHKNTGLASACYGGCGRERPSAATERPFSEPVCFGYCGNLQWTIEKHGRVTHKQSCPRRVEPWCQSHPAGCPSDCQAIGSRARP